MKITLYAVLLTSALATGIVPPAQPTPRLRSLRVQDRETGTLEGHVILAPRLSSRRPRFRLYAEYGQGAALPRPDSAASSEMGNVIIYLDSGASLVPVPAGAPMPEMRQRNQAFAPHVLAVPAGTTVSFPNADPFFHNVFSLSRTRSFDLGRYPEGATKTVTFDRPGAVQVFCHIHSDMSAVVFVTPTAWFTSPQGDGTYRMAEIPAGTYQVVAWHERAKPIRETIVIEPGKTTRLDFNIPIPDVDRR